MPVQKQARKTYVRKMATTVGLCLFDMKWFVHIRKYQRVVDNRIAKTEKTDECSSETQHHSCVDF